MTGHDERSPATKARMLRTAAICFPISAICFFFIMARNEERQALAFIGAALFSFFGLYCAWTAKGLTPGRRPR